MQGSLKVKDIRGVIPSLSSLLCIYFPGRRPLCHHTSLPSSITQNSSWHCSCVIPPAFATTFQLQPLSAASEGCPLYFYPRITDVFVSLLLPASGSLLVSPLPWECLISSDTPNWKLITKRTDHAIHFIKHYFYACNNRPVLHTLKIWLRCFCCKYLWVTQGLTWWWSTGLPNTSPTHTSCNSSPQSQRLQRTYSRILSLHFKRQQWFFFVPTQEEMMGKGPPELKQCRGSSSTDCKPQGFQQS